MTMMVFQNIAGKILAETSAWTGVADKLLDIVLPMILIGLTIKIMWQGFGIIRGVGGQHHLLDVFANSLRTFLVVTLALAGGAYNTNVVQFMQGLKNELIGQRAKDLLGDLIGYRSQWIFSEEEKANPNHAQILKWEEEQGEFSDVRTSLDVLDEVQVKAVFLEYGVQREAENCIITAQIKAGKP